MAAGVIIKISEDIDIDHMLRNVLFETRHNAIFQAVGAAMRVVVAEAKQRVPVGDPNIKPELKALKDTISHVVRKYQDGLLTVGVVGPQWPAGAHGDLVEKGHNVYRRGAKGASLKGTKSPPLTGSARVEGKFYLASAVDASQSKQDDAVIRVLQRHIMKAGG